MVDDKVRDFDLQMQMMSQLQKKKHVSKFDDRLNSSGSDRTDTGTDPSQAKKDYMGGDGGWDYTRYTQSRASIEIDIGSVDIFSLARHGHLAELNAVL